VQLIAIGLKALAGGTLVAGFSVLGDLLKPKAFAGIFGAAPSVALASLLITAVTSGGSKAATSAHGMIAGAVGMVCYCIAASALVKRFGALGGSILAWVAWIVPSVLVYWFMIR
jgi:hypothetical protein